MNDGNHNKDNVVYAIVCFESFDGLFWWYIMIYGGEMW